MPRLRRTSWNVGFASSVTWPPLRGSASQTCSTSHQLRWEWWSWRWCWWSTWGEGLEIEKGLNFAVLLIIGEKLITPSISKKKHKTHTHNHNHKHSLVPPHRSRSGSRTTVTSQRRRKCCRKAPSCSSSAPSCRPPGWTATSQTATAKISTIHKQSALAQHLWEYGIAIENRFIWYFSDLPMLSLPPYLQM